MDKCYHSVVIGALGSVRKKFERWMAKLEIKNNIGVMQKTNLLETARILRSVRDVES